MWPPQGFDPRTCPAGSKSGRSSIGNYSQIYVTNFISVCVSVLLFLRMNAFGNFYIYYKRKCNNNRVAVFVRVYVPGIAYYSHFVTSIATI